MVCVGCCGVGSLESVDMLVLCQLGMSMQPVGGGVGDQPPETRPSDRTLGPR